MMADFSLRPSGNGNNYTGMLTRSIVFSVALLVFLAGMLACATDADIRATDLIFASIWDDACLDHRSQLGCL